MVKSINGKISPKDRINFTKGFTIKEHVGDYITVLRVEEEQIGRIRVWGYHPISYNKKWKKNNPKDEYPFLNWKYDLFLEELHWKHSLEIKTTNRISGTT